MSATGRYGARLEVGLLECLVLAVQKDLYAASPSHRSVLLGPDFLGRAELCVWLRDCEGQRPGWKRSRRGRRTRELRGGPRELRRRRGTRQFRRRPREFG